MSIRTKLNGIGQALAAPINGASTTGTGPHHQITVTSGSTISQPVNSQVWLSNSNSLAYPQTMIDQVKEAIMKEVRESILAKPATKE